ncbi:MAG: hypothetical protein ACLFPV_07250 [Spirochaetaceae bacterium]
MAAAARTGEKKAKEIFTMLADGEQKQQGSQIRTAHGYPEGKSISTPGDLSGVKLRSRLRIFREYQSMIAVRDTSPFAGRIMCRINRPHLIRSSDR